MMNTIEKQRLNHLTHWPDEIVNAIASMEEANIYIKAGLKAARIGNRWALIRSDIDWADFSVRRNTWLKNRLADYDRWKDYNNADLVGEGFPPRDVNGDPYELHHIGQRQDSPFAELTWAEHMGTATTPSSTKLGRSRKSTASSSTARSRTIGRLASRRSRRLNSIYKS